MSTCTGESEEGRKRRGEGGRRELDRIERRGKNGGLSLGFDGEKKMRGVRRVRGFQCSYGIIIDFVFELELPGFIGVGKLGIAT